MKIKIKTCFAGPDIVWNVGDIVDVTKAQGDRLIELDHAELVNVDKKTEKSPKLKTYKGSKKDVKKNTLSDSKGSDKVIKTTIS